MAMGGKTTPYEGERSGAAQLLAGQGQQEFATGTGLLAPEMSGQLPTGAQSAVDLQFRNAINQIKAKYGSLGQTGSTMEADALANTELQKAAMQFQIANDMAKQGISLLGLGQTGVSNSASIYQGLAHDQMQEDKQLMEAIANFAKLAGSAAGTGPVGTAIGGAITGMFGGGGQGGGGSQGDGAGGDF